MRQNKSERVKRVAHILPKIGGVMRQKCHPSRVGRRRRRRANGTNSQPPGGESLALVPPSGMTRVDKWVVVAW